jgi:hypothetical protein
MTVIIVHNNPTDNIISNIVFPEWASSLIDDEGEQCFFRVYIIPNIIKKKRSSEMNQ